MKKIYYLLMLIFGFGLMISCDRSEEELKNLGSYEVDDIEYQINDAHVQGYISTSGNKNNNYVFTFTTDNRNDNYNKVVLAVSFPYNSTSIDGTYVIGGAPRRLDPWLSQYTVITGKHTQTFNNLLSGTCTITRKSDTEFKVKFDFMPQHGQKVRGEFEGEVSLTENPY